MTELHSPVQELHGFRGSWEHACALREHLVVLEGVRCACHEGTENAQTVGKMATTQGVCRPERSCQTPPMPCTAHAQDPAHGSPDLWAVRQAWLCASAWQPSGPRARRSACAGMPPWRERTAGPPPQTGVTLCTTGSKRVMHTSAG